MTSYNRLVHLVWGQIDLRRIILPAWVGWATVDATLDTRVGMQFRARFVVSATRQTLLLEDVAAVLAAECARSLR